MPSKKRGGLSKREYSAKMAGKEMPYHKKRKMQMEALKKKVYMSGMKNGKPIDFMSKKTKRGIITSLD